MITSPLHLKKKERAAFENKGKIQINYRNMTNR